MTPKVIPFETWHLLAIMGRPEIETDLRVVNLMSLADIYLRQGPAYTIVAGDDILWCGGLAAMWCGVAEGWAVPSIIAQDYPVTIHRTVKRTLRKLIQTMNLTRVQCSVVHGFKQSRDWVKRLGFRFEGKMPNYGPGGATHYRFAWVKKWDQ